MPEPSCAPSAWANARSDSPTQITQCQLSLPIVTPCAATPFERARVGAVGLEQAASIIAAIVAASVSKRVPDIGTSEKRMRT